MEAPSEFTLESVRDYILSRGGKVTNHELVKHFKVFLTNPVLKDQSRAQFKEFVNTLASIKLEDGEKFLVLKKKYRSGLLAEVFGDLGAETGGFSLSASALPTEPLDASFSAPSRTAPPPYRPPPPPAFSTPTPYQPGGVPASYRSVSGPSGLGLERQASVDEYYHVPESRLYSADPQPVGLPAVPPPELLERASPRRFDRSPRAPVPEPPDWRPPPPPLDRPVAAQFPSQNWRTAVPSQTSLDRHSPPEPPNWRAPPPGQDTQDGVEPLEAHQAPSPNVHADGMTGPMDPPPPVPPRRRSMVGKENQTPVVPSVTQDARAIAEQEAREEEERLKKISVKEQTQKFNKIASESQLVPQPKQPFGKRRDKNTQGSVDDEDSSSTTTFEGVNKEWILVTSSCKYMEILRMLKDNPKLAKHKDFITGYTALHWAAKHANLDIIKLIAGTHGGDVNSPSHGGYTPLHIAMQYGHEDVFDLLVHTYGADPNLRDYSGKKPRQYKLREETTLSSEAFRKIKKKRTSDKSEKESFLRIGSINVRVKKTTEAFNSLINQGLQMGDRLHRSWGSSESIGDGDRDLMPPPKFSIKKRKSKKPQDFASLKSRISAPILQPGGGLPMPGSPAASSADGRGSSLIELDPRRRSEADLVRRSSEDTLSHGTGSLSALTGESASLRGDDSDSDYGFGSNWAP